MRSPLQIIERPTFPGPEGVRLPEWASGDTHWMWSPIGGSWQREATREFRFDDGVGFTLAATQSCPEPGRLVWLGAGLEDVTLECLVRPADLRTLSRWFAKSARILDHVS